jgi:hypothetical protein
MAKMPKFKYVLGRRFFVQNKVTVSVTVNVRMSLMVRLWRSCGWARGFAASR